MKRYPEFVPWVTSMRVYGEREESPGVTAFDAEAAVGFSLLKERWTTHVRRDAGSLQIDVGLIRGPFRKLTNYWAFHPHPQGCSVDFRIEFEFKSRLLDAVLAGNFDRAVNKIMGCFEARAAALYTPGASAQRLGG